MAVCRLPALAAVTLQAPWPAFPLRRCSACLAKSTDATGLECVTAASSPSPVPTPTSSPSPAQPFASSPSPSSPAGVPAPPASSSVNIVPIAAGAAIGIAVIAAIIALVFFYKRRGGGQHTGKPHEDVLECLPTP
jgi:hypothetical protein